MDKFGQTVYPEDSLMVIDTQSDDLAAFKGNQFIYVEVKATLIEFDSKEELASDTYNFSIRFERE